MRTQKFKRENERVRSMTLAELRKQAARNKRLVRNALEARFRKAYALRRALGRAYGAEIARRLSAK